MQEDEIGDRMLTAVSGVPLWYVRTGKWNRVPAYAEKIKAAYDLKNAGGWKMYHDYVINMPTDKIITKIKKWYYTKVGKGNPAIIVYDYIKLTGEPTSEYNKEYQIIGEKINSLKALLGKDINAPLLTALQLNRLGDSSKGKQNDDSTAISLSDRALWFASFVGIFRRKTLEELGTEGEDNGTHKLIPIESRWQGEKSFGHHDHFRRVNGEVRRYFINYQVDNFNVEELHSGQDMFNNIDMGPLALKSGGGELDKRQKVKEEPKKVKEEKKKKEEPPKEPDLFDPFRLENTSPPTVPSLNL
jgi:hypothetical protein